MKLRYVIVFLACTSCAHFSTKQTDISFDSDGSRRTITTEASATTFWSSSSELSKFRATQTDKTQSASVGSLSQQGNEPTNTLSIIEAIVTSAVRAAVKP